MIAATTAELQNNLLQYLDLVMSGNEIVITKNGEEIGRFVPKGAVVSYLTDSLAGILQGNSEGVQERATELRRKYEIAD